MSRFLVGKLISRSDRVFHHFSPVCYHNLSVNERISFRFNPNTKRCRYFKQLAVLVGVGSGLLLNNWLKSNNLNIESSFADCLSTKGKGLRDRFNFIADVVEDAAEAVVYIEILDNKRRAFSDSPTTISNGSGFIIESDGLILTNAHVVVQHYGHNIIRVRLTDGRTFQGTLVNVDMKSDIATIRIKANNLPVMKLGQSDDLRPGEWVVAIGSPLTLSNTITAGVVSASQRPAKELGLPHSGINYIQTDASITFGNSGGPLVNLDGEAIGINSIKITAGISFAIPIDYAKEFLTKSQKKGNANQSVSSKFIGITMVTLKPEFIHALHVRGVLSPDVTSGILVWKIAENGPAYRAGLRPGDVLTHVNGKVVNSVQQIYEALETSQKLIICAVRNGHPMEVQITPEET